MRAIIAFCSAIIFATSASCEMIPGSDIRYGNWSGEAYVNDETGQFSHCVVAAPFLSGDTLLLSVNREISIGVGVANENFGLRPGHEFPVALFIDRREPFFGTATAVSDSFAVLHLQDFERALDALRRGFRLTIQSPLGQRVYDLSGTFRALEAAVICAQRYFNYSRPPAQITRREFDKTILFQVATEIISELQLNDFRYLTSSEVGEIIDFEAVFWEAPASGMSGGVILAPVDEVRRLSDTDSGDIAFLTYGCEGDTATTTRNFQGTEADYREIRALCLQDGNQRESLLTKFFVGRNVFYVLVQFHNDSGSQPERDSRSISEDVVLRAASYVQSISVSE